MRRQPAIVIVPSERRLLAGFLGLVLIVASIGWPGSARAATACATSGPSNRSYSIEVCLIAPDEGATLAGDQAVQATYRVVTGSVPGRRGMQFFVDGEKVLHDYFVAPGSSPARYEMVLPTQRWVDGVRRLEARAAMTDGFVTDAAGVSATFENGVTEPPVNDRTFTPAVGTSPPAGTPFVVAAVGDGADGGANTANVANLVDDLDPNMFLYLGDIYEHGTPTEFYNYYRPTFGRFRSISNPTIGNHEWPIGDGAGYFDYWDNIPHYYSVDAAGWHIVSLNMINDFEQDTADSAQYRWLEQDLDRSTAACTLVIVHNPAIRLHTDPDPVNSRWEDFWALLAAHGVEAVLSGDNHNYQRWKPLAGNFSTHRDGVTQFVVGTGGRPFSKFTYGDARFAAGSDDSYGVLRMELNAEGASFQFLSTAGAALDTGSIPCNPGFADTTPPTSPTLAATSDDPTEVDLAWTAATDNVGVTGYDVFRDGGQVASVVAPGTTWVDTTVEADKSYRYTVRARDAAGNLSQPSNETSVTTSAPPTSTTTFVPQADARVEQLKPDANFGAGVLRADFGAIDSVESYLRFTVTGLSGVRSARLRLYVPDVLNANTTNGPAVYAVPENDWSETGITWNTRPALTGGGLDDKGSLARGTWAEFDVSSIVTGDGTYTFGLRTTSSDGVDFNSRESLTNKPELVVTSTGPTAGDTTPPSAPQLTLTESEPVAHLVGSTLFYNPAGAGSFTVAATTTDAESGIAEVAFPTVFGGDALVDTVAPYGTSYSWSAGASAAGPRTVTTTNGVGLTASSEFTVTPDTEAPSVTLTAPAAGATVGDGLSVSAEASDAGAGVGQVEFRYCAGTSCDWAAGTAIGAPDTVAPHEVAWTDQPADGEYTLVARATDQVGHTRDSAPVTVTVANGGPPPSTTTVLPQADAEVAESKPTTSFGTANRLTADGDAGLRFASYLRFSLSDVVGTVQSARLRLFVKNTSTSATNNGPEVWATDTGWTEAGLTWDTRPPAAGAASLDDKGALPAGAWVEYDVSDVVNGNGEFAFVLLADSNDAVVFDSRESLTNKPELVVTSTGPTAGDTTPPP